MLKRSCRKEQVVSSPAGEVLRCSCGTYYVCFGLMTLCFSAFEFETIARLFKISLGMITAKRSIKSKARPVWEETRTKLASYQE